MSIEPYELEEIPPQGHVKIVYTGSVAPHWEIHRVFGDQRGYYYERATWISSSSLSRK